MYLYLIINFFPLKLLYKISFTYQLCCVCTERSTRVLAVARGRRHTIVGNTMLLVSATVAATLATLALLSDWYCSAASVFTLYLHVRFLSLFSTFVRLYCMTVRHRLTPFVQSLLLCVAVVRICCVYVIFLSLSLFVHCVGRDCQTSWQPGCQLRRSRGATLSSINSQRNSASFFYLLYLIKIKSKIYT